METRFLLRAFSPGLLPAALALLTVAVPQWAQAQATLDKIKSRGQINVGYRALAAPFSFHQTAEKPLGYSIAFCQPIIESLRQAAGNRNLPVRYIETEVDARVRLLAEGSVDLLCENVTDTPERRARMDFSTPIYIDAIQVAVRNKDKIVTLAQLQGKSIVGIDGSTAAPALQRYGQPRSLNWQFAKAVNPDAALGQLQMGWAAGYARDGVMLAAQLAALPDAADYSILPDRLSVETIAIAYRKGDAAMGALVNASIKESMRSGAAQGWYEQWFLKPAKPGGKPLATAMPAEMKALFEAAKAN
ncbi:amino acid ABC transporter substrate-binding protein [Polaromonas sp. YR568]|uniref:amino acid ABC transporter substrate-binding protein n=1 Tax=Polaromonas sp. YR568 TaxID=1855301 RepID=UPI00398BFB2B